MSTLGTPAIASSSTSTLEPALARAREAFARDGWCPAPPLIPRELVERAAARMDAVMAGEYATGVAPLRSWNPGDDPTRLRKIDQVHLSDPVLAEVASHREIGRWAAAITGARTVSLWAVQMLYKPEGGAALGSVGFHQDRRYWGYWTEESEVFTAWIALSDVTADAGPMRFANGSQRWGFLQSGDYFDTNDADPSRLEGVPSGEAWVETPAILPPGAVSFHHRLTFHGSGPNRSRGPRRAMALHLRTERSAVVPGATDYYVSHLDDPRYCPVLYRG